MTDHLKALPIDRVAAWYRRLAAMVGQKKVSGAEPYASVLLRHYLDNRDPNSTFTIEARGYLKSNPRVTEALAYHRRVFLSQEAARVGGGTKLGGIVPRLRGQGHRQLAVPGKAPMNYESLVQIGDGALDILRIQTRGSDTERDLFTSLRGFQLRSDVHVDVAAAQAGKVRVRFETWLAEAHDRYDWDYNEHLTMPNPDFGSKAAGAVRPMDQQLTVYHSNAKRLEDAKLAAPFYVKSAQWAVMDPTLRADALVSP